MLGGADKSNGDLGTYITGADSGLIYQLGNGTGRQRGKVSGMARPVNVWRTMLISTGEMTVGKHMESGGQRIKAGQEMRLLDIPVQRLFGAFDHLHGLALPHNPDDDTERRGAGRRFAETLRGNAASHYGHAGPEFVRWLIARSGTSATSRGGDGLSLADIFARLREQFPVSTGQEARAAARFTLCALAGEMAITAGVLPWTQGEALAAVKVMFEAWVEYRGRGQSEDVKILRAVAGFIARHASRFEGAGQQGEAVNNRAGWWRQDGNGGRLYWFLQEALCEAASGYDLKRIAASLNDAGAIAERDTDGTRRFTKRVSVNGEKHRVYVISQSELLCAIDE